MKFSDIPSEFINENYNKALDICDAMTPMFCFCGKLATGFHTNSCRKFRYRVEQELLKMYKNGGK